MKRIKVIITKHLLRIRKVYVRIHYLCEKNWTNFTLSIKEKLAQQNTANELRCALRCKSRHLIKRPDCTRCCALAVKVI